MKLILTSQYVDIPEGVTVEHKSRVVTVTGPRGKLVRNLKHVACEMAVTGNKMRIDMWMSRKKELAALRSVASHINNMCIGVTQGYSYSVRFVYNHFPINVAVDGQVISIRNFLGEKIVRRVVVPDDTKIDSTGGGKKDCLVLTSNDINSVTQTCAKLHGITLVRRKDIRKFLDGIYVEEGGAIAPPEE